MAVGRLAGVSDRVLQLGDLYLWDPVFQSIWDGSATFGSRYGMATFGSGFAADFAAAVMGRGLAVSTSPNEVSSTPLLG